MTSSEESEAELWDQLDTLLLACENLDSALSLPAHDPDREMKILISCSWVDHIIEKDCICSPTMLISVDEERRCLEDLLELGKSLQQALCLSNDDPHREFKIFIAKANLTFIVECYASMPHSPI